MVDAKKAYLLISLDSKATTLQLQSAWIAMEEARIAATEKATGKILNLDRLKLNIEKDKQHKPGENLNLLGKNSFDAFNQSFQSSIQGLLMGTKNFRSAWGGMVQSMLSAWTGSLAQMATQWAAHQLQKLALHVLTNLGIVASDASTAAASNTISLMQHLREIGRAAAQAAAHAWAAVSAIPIVGPALAPAAAAATFVGVMALGAVSAERGADLPNYNTMGVLHPREMVLPREQADVIRGLAKGGGAGGGMQNNFHGDMNYNAPKGQTFTSKQWVNMGKQALRNRPSLRPA